MNFKLLTSQIADIHTKLYKQATAAINIALTTRNWWIGAHIVEYEQNGDDKAKYGTGLIVSLAQEIGIKGLSETNLRICRQFYNLYPYLYSEIEHSYLKKPIHQSVTDEFKMMQIFEKRLKNTASEELRVPANKILTKLSFTHLAELIKIEDTLKRTFYEIECINGTWSVNELKRQIATQYFERSGLSKDKEKLSKLVNQKAEQITAADILKNPMTFEFLNLPIKDILEESDIEQALIDNLQYFLLELGTGFCFESRQKRILIDDEYFFIDLVFYHRILRTHVLIEIKNDEFTHEHIG